jgi:uncharacterized protein (TIGR03382 family)
MPVFRPILAFLLLASPSSAFAIRPNDDSALSIELASGAAARIQPDVEVRPIALGEGRWNAMWDRQTKVPLRIWGSGISAPRSEGNALAAEEFSRAFLAQHIALLAPGSAIEDFELASNVLSGGVRSVGFVQSRRGVKVARGQISFRFKFDRMIAVASEAFPNLQVEIGPRRISPRLAMQVALQWTDGRVERVNDPVIRAVVLEDGTIAAAHVIPVIVSTRNPIGRWEVDIDAVTGRPFARRQTLLFGAGSLQYNVPERRPGGTRWDAPAKLTDVGIDGATVRTADDGTLSWTSTSAVRVATSVTGSLVDVTNGDGTARATATLELSDGGAAIWNEAADEKKDAQLTAFIAARTARDYMEGLVPNLRVLNAQLPVVVNIADVCNAFSDGLSINFFQSGSGCENTARLPDVVRHEYGHTIHFHAIIPGVGDFESALSEGGADYLAATMVNDSGMGRGFFFTDDPLRELDPSDRERIWPTDIDRDPHETGLIFAGAMWDLRKLMIEKYGMERGVELTDRLWYGVFERATSIPTSYVEVLVGNDDDGDLDNGTPDMCAVTDVFRAHGLAGATDAGLDIGTVSLDGWNVSLPVTEKGLCPGFEVTSATMVWERRGSPGSGATLPMTKDGDVYKAAIPEQDAGNVVRYRVTLEVASGEILNYPDNAADPFYETFIGTVTPIYCTDFESDPMDQGWSHEMIRGSGMRARDEWEWGSLNSDPSSGDPSRAFSGDNVVGNDIGLTQFGFGTYQRNKVEELKSPVIDVSGHQVVRLQYRRWLTVEDADFDQAEILVGDTQLWSNFASADGMGGTNHIDREWRFHDVDLTSVVEQTGAQIQIIYRLTSDDGYQLGGWTIDDFCLMGWDAPPPPEMPPPEMPPPEMMMPMPDDPGPKLIEDEGGCGCTSARTSGSIAIGWLLLGLALLVRRR